jgi:hypothetical protein
MSHSLLSLPVDSRRDLLTARQRARQIAGLVGLDSRQRAAVAAAVFEAASGLPFGGTVSFWLRGSALHVHVDGAGKHPRLVFALPDSAGTPSPEDVACLAEILERLTPRGVFAEVRQMNRDFLRTLQELQAVRGIAETGPQKSAA